MRERGPRQGGPAERRSMGQHYHEGQRALQDRYDTRRLADRLADATSDVISEPHRAFIEARDMFFIASADADGWPQVSDKGGEPGFVRVTDSRHLTFPVYDGNGMFLTAGNLATNPQVALLFVDWATGTRLRANGWATICGADAASPPFPGARFTVRVRVREVFANCRQYVHRMSLVERSPFVPTTSGDGPVPDWKHEAWLVDTLPADDPALIPGRRTAPSLPLWTDPEPS
jgi:uncharacterized protein